MKPPCPEVDVGCQSEVLSGIQCAAGDVAGQQSQFLIVADEEWLLLGAVALRAVIVRMETVGIEVLAVIVFTVSLGIDVKFHSPGVSGRLDGDHSLADMIAELQSDGRAAIARVGLFSVNRPFAVAAFGDASRRQ